MVGLNKTMFALIGQITQPIRFSSGADVGAGVAIASDLNRAFLF